MQVAAESTITVYQFPVGGMQTPLIIRCGDDDSVVECYAEDGEDEGNEDDQELQLCCWHDIISIIG